MKTFISFLYTTRYYYIIITSCILQSYTTASTDTIPPNSDGKVHKSIYSLSETQKSKFYNKLWGKHYRSLYSKPISVEETTINTLSGGLTFIDQAPRVYGLLMRDKIDRMYLIRPIGGSTTFLESSFFKSIYNTKDFNNTYVGDFIKDGYTITHPYAFLATDRLAKQVDLNFHNPKLYYLAPNTTNDTIADGTCINDRLISVYHLDSFTSQSNIIYTSDLLEKLQTDKSVKIDMQLYIRERLFDMLIGDWYKTPENWRWKEQKQNDSLIYTPLVVDRMHAFPRVDGILFKGVLGMFGLKCIEDYGYDMPDLRRFNKLGFALDVALTGETTEDLWLQQANYIKHSITKESIDEAFSSLPPEMHGIETEIIKQKLELRLCTLDKTAVLYYRLLQKTPVVTGTNNEDRIIVDRTGKRNIEVSIYNSTFDTLHYNKKYDKYTDEIWIYGLNGNDYFHQRGKSGKGYTPIVLIGGKDTSNYNIENGKELTIYDYKFKKQNYDSISQSKLVLTNVDSALNYDYEKLKYSTFDFTPWGIYDSDLGLYLGLYATKTVYGFKRTPYSYRHRVGYNYLNGFMYIGSFPSFDERKTFMIEAYVGTAKNFTNFFGYGNNTNGFKNEKRNYNRVNIRKYSVTPSFYFNFCEGSKFIAKSSFELVKIDDTNDRYINTIYGKDNNIFNTNLYGDINLTYQFDKALSSSISSFNWSITGGYKIDLGNWQMNFPYMDSKFSFNWKMNDRFTWATQIKGKAIFNNEYRFYHSASTELRGFRNNRFIGRQSLYQYTDIRLDLGNLDNPFMPLGYGVFGGFDYGRVWYPGEYSKKWHASYGGGFWITLFKGYTGKFSYFGSDDGSRFTFGLGMGF